MWFSFVVRTKRFPPSRTSTHHIVSATETRTNFHSAIQIDSVSVIIWPRNVMHNTTNRKKRNFVHFTSSYSLLCWFVIICSEFIDVQHFCLKIQISLLSFIRNVFFYFFVFAVKKRRNHLSPADFSVVRVNLWNCYSLLSFVRSLVCRGRFVLQLTQENSVIGRQKEIREIK